MSANPQTPDPSPLSCSECLHLCVCTNAVAAWRDVMMHAIDFREVNTDPGPEDSVLKEIQQVCAGHCDHYSSKTDLGDKAVIAGYFPLRDFMESQAEWSKETFGPGKRTGGICKHIRKELKEIEEAPTDLKEWVDVLLLALDGVWRSGHSADHLYAALLVKQQINIERTWPKPGPEGEPTEHVREVSTQPDLSGFHAPHVVRATGCTFGEDISVGAFSEVGPNVSIGDRTRIGAFAFIPAGVTIGKDCFIGPRVTFTNDKYPPSKGEGWDATFVGDRAIIGAGAIILPGAHIGDCAFVAAGSVVTKDVCVGMAVKGNPARQFKLSREVN